jgi:hypothetical protein
MTIIFTLPFTECEAAMKLSILALALTLSASANVAAQTETGHSQVSGVYRIYGGGLVDSVPATSRDSKIMFAVTGRTARDMFNAMGPDVNDECTAGNGMRVRQKDNGNLLCTLSKKGEYSCNFGFHLRTGKSIGGSAC